MRSNMYLSHDYDYYKSNCSKDKALIERRIIINKSYTVTSYMSWVRYENIIALTNHSVLEIQKKLQFWQLHYLPQTENYRRDLQNEEKFSKKTPWLSWKQYFSIFSLLCKAESDQFDAFLFPSTLLFLSCKCKMHNESLP